MKKTLHQFSSDPRGASPALPTVAPGSIRDDFERKIRSDTFRYFKDLYDLDGVFEKLVTSLVIFLNRSEEHCSFNFWSGDTLTGKTTLAKRFSGKENFPIFNTGNIKTHYYEWFNLKDNFDEIKKSWLDKNIFPPNSIIFIDDAEKCLNPTLKLVDEVFVEKFRSLLDDISRTKKFYIVFLSQEKNNRESVTKLLGTKITSLCNFSYNFPVWSQKSLVELILKTLDKKGLEMDLNAVSSLAQHCYAHGKISEFQVIIDTLVTQLHGRGSNHISEKLITEIIASRS